MSVEALLQQIERLGIRLVVTGNQLRAIGPPSLPRDQARPLLESLRQHRPEVLAILRKRPATCSSTCYEMEPGRWIHHDGCKTSPRHIPSIPQAECHHCDAKGECECPACTLRQTEEPVHCLMCQPEKREQWLTSTVENRCWHCHGSRVCRCIVCWSARTDTAGECVVCHGAGTVLGRVN
jgi:hypothetical protein